MAKRKLAKRLRRVILLSPKKAGRAAIILVILFTARPLVASPSFAFRVMPGYYVPVGDDYLKPGAGGSIAVDFLPTSFFGFTADGEYVSVGLENVDPLSLVSGSLGMSGLWSPAERWSLRAELLAGIYSVSGQGDTISGIEGGTRLSGSYRFNPVVSGVVFAGFRHYSYRPTPFMNSISAGAGIEVNLTEAFASNPHVSATVEKQDPVFPVFYSWYDEHSLATVKLTNNEKETITDVTASFYLEQYMGQPKFCSLTKTLKPGESVEIPIKAFFNESMLELTEKIDAEAKVIVEYRRLGSKRRAEIPMTVPVYHRNAMNWDDDRRAAAFASANDPAALWFSKYASSIVTERFRPGVNKNVQFAIGLFESLKTYGLSYVVDPSSAYSDNADSGSSIDFLQYPYQTLMYRGGDCDDLSILYCSLFQACGIDAAFITIPGHIYVAFSTGMSEEEAKSEFYAPDQLVYYGGTAWVPLEITLTKDNFTKAWKTGFKEWNDAAVRGQANIYPVKEAWGEYKPVSVPGATSRFSLPPEEQTAVAFDGDVDMYIEREIRPQILAYEDALGKKNSAALRNRYGVLYGRYGLNKEATAQFAVAARSGNVDAWVNLGNVSFQAGEYDAALKYYRYVLAIDSENSVALLGAARCYYELEQFSYSDALYEELCERDYALSRKYTYLASFFENTGRAWSLSDRLSTTTWAVSSDVAVPVAEPKAAPQEKIDAKKFIASLKDTDFAPPEISWVDDAAPQKTAAREIAPEPPVVARREDSYAEGLSPAASPATVAAPPEPRAGLAAMLSIGSGDQSGKSSSKKILASMNFRKEDAPALPTVVEGDDGKYSLARVDTGPSSEIAAVQPKSRERTSQANAQAPVSSTRGFSVAGNASAGNLAMKDDLSANVSKQGAESAVVEDTPKNRRSSVVIAIIAAIASAIAGAIAITQGISRRARTKIGGKKL